MSSTLFTMLNVLDTSKEITNTLKSVENIILPIIYALSGSVLVFCVVKFGFKIQNDPRNKGIYIKHLIWCVIGCIIVLVASGIAHIVFDQLLRIKSE